jgi:hypothetical protein
LRIAALFLATGLTVAPVGAMELVYDGGGIVPSPQTASDHNAEDGDDDAILRFSSASGSLALSATEITRAKAWFDNGVAGINLRLSDAAAGEFGALTGRSVGGVVTLSVCGDDLMSATVQAPIASGAIGVTTVGFGTAVWYARVLEGEIGCDGKTTE